MTVEARTPQVPILGLLLFFGRILIQTPIRKVRKLLFLVKLYLSDSIINPEAFRYVFGY